MVLLALVDAKYKVVYISMGCNSDGGIVAPFSLDTQGFVWKQTQLAIGHNYPSNRSTRCPAVYI